MHTFTSVANGDYVVVVVGYTNDANFQFVFTHGERTWRKLNQCGLENVFAAPP